MSTIFSSIRSLPRGFLFILAAGLLLRILFITLHQRPAISDEKEYDQLALNLALENEYSYGTSPTTYRPVGYPALVSIVYRVAGYQPLAVKYLQAVLDMSSAAIIFLLLSGYTVNVALLATALWAFYPPAVFYTNFLLSETLFTFLLTATVFLLVQIGKSRNISTVALGIVVGLMCLVKPGAMLFLLIPLLLFQRLQLNWKKSAILISAALLVLTPWLVRNYLTFGEFALTSNGGINLLIGNHPASNGAYNLSFDTAFIHDAKGEFAVDKIAQDQAVEFITREPGTFLLLAARKLAHFFESEGGILVWSFHPEPENSTRFASKYANVPIVATIATNLAYMILMLGGVVGFLAAKKDETWNIVALLGILWILLHVVFFGGSRFHFPLMPALVLYAAPAFFNPMDSLRRLDLKRRLIGAAICCLLLSLWTFEGLVVFYG